MKKLLCALHVQDEEGMAFYVCSLFFYRLGEFTKSIVARSVNLHMCSSIVLHRFLDSLFNLNLRFFLHLLVRLQDRLANTGSAEPPAFKGKKSVQVMPVNIVKNTLPTALNGARRNVRAQPYSIKDHTRAT